MDLENSQFSQGKVFSGLQSNDKGLGGTDALLNTPAGSAIEHFDATRSSQVNDPFRYDLGFQGQGLNTLPTTRGSADRYTTGGASYSASGSLARPSGLWGSASILLASNEQAPNLGNITGGDRAAIESTLKVLPLESGFESVNASIRLQALTAVGDVRNTLAGQRGTDLQQISHNAVAIAALSTAITQYDSEHAEPNELEYRQRLDLNLTEYHKILQVYERFDEPTVLLDTEVPFDSLGEARPVYTRQAFAYSWTQANPEAVAQAAKSLVSNGEAFDEENARKQIETKIGALFDKDPTVGNKAIVAAITVQVGTGDAEASSLASQARYEDYQAR